MEGGVLGGSVNLEVKVLRVGIRTALRTIPPGCILHNKRSIQESDRNWLWGTGKECVL